MKKLLTILSLFIFTSVFSQTKKVAFIATSAEMYVKNNDDWSLFQKNGSTNIDIKLEEGILTIFAEKLSVYRIDSKTMKELNNKSYEGLSYDAKELKDEENCRLSIVRYKDTGKWLLSIKYEMIILNYDLIQN